jgi:hypothetical protein
MAIGDTKIFDFIYSGLTLQVTAIDSGNGTTDFQIKCISGSADVNALWWGDETNDGSSPTLSKSDNSLNMNGTSVDWDGYEKLSSTGLGNLGWDKVTALTAGESYYANNIGVVWDDIDTLGIRATSTSTDGGSIKGVDSSALVQELPSVSVGDAVAVTEGGTAQFTIALSNTYPYDVKVCYQTQNGSATEGSDYTVANSYVIIPAGQTTSTINIGTIDNNVYELTENFTVKLTDAKADIPDSLGPDIALNFTDDSGLGTITDNEPQPTVAISDGTPNPQSETSGATITFTVSLSGPADKPVTVTYSTVNGSATAGTDFVGATNATVVIPAGQTSADIVVDVVDDSVFELAEAFTVEVSSAVYDAGGANAGFVVSDAVGTGNIADDDPMPSFSIDDVIRSEAHGTISFTVTKTGATAVSATVDYAVVADTATTPDDYIVDDPLNGTLTFLPGDTTKTITLNITNDMTFEQIERFFVNLSGATNATISDSQGIGTITDDDPAGPAFGPTLTGDALPSATNGESTGDPTNNDNDGLTGGTNTSFPSGTTNLTTNNDTVTDTSSGGNRTINGLDGADTIYAGPNGDTLNGGGGDDYLYGQNGNDTLNGGDGNDHIYGGSGNDSIDGGGGNDIIYAGTGQETGSNTIHGGSGDDIIYAGSGQDTIAGEAGADHIYGGFGSDVIDLGLIDDSSIDTVYYLNLQDTNDTIGGFVSGQDKIDLSALDAISGGSDDAFAWAGQVPGDLAKVAANSVSWYTSGGNVTVLADTDGNVATAEFQITLTGITTINQSDFIL